MSKYQYTIGKILNLVEEQERTLSGRKLKSNFILQVMYVTFDVLYGAKSSLQKFKVLEILARYPYWAWENGCYLRLSRLFAKKDKASEENIALLHNIISLGREAQDNEQYHMFLLDSIIRQKGIKLGFIRYVVLPRIMGYIYYYLTRIIYFFSPVASFQMNAAFESHAEYEYMKMAKENPQWDNEPVDSVYFKYYPRQKTLNDLIRRIALDERDHKNSSLEEIERFFAN